MEMMNVTTNPGESVILSREAYEALTHENADLKACITDLNARNSDLKAYVSELEGKLNRLTEPMSFS